MNIKVAEQNKAVNPSKGRVVISPNPIRVSERLDKDGNVVHPITGQIIRRVDELI